MKHFIVIGAADGLERWRGQGVASEQTVPGDLIVMEVPQDSIAVVPTDLDAIKAHYATKVDEYAEVVRLQFLTPGVGMALAYVEKALEADAYALNSSHPVPFIAAEAAEMGITVAQMVTEVNTARAQFRLIGPRIESARRGAKMAITAATTPGEILAATQIDWTAVINGGS